MDDRKIRKAGTAFVLLQGLVTALFPRVSVRLTMSMIGKNFDNSSDLTATPAYLRQLRAIGVGTVAAAGTDLLLQSAEETSDEPAEAGGSDDGETTEGAGSDR